MKHWKKEMLCVICVCAVVFLGGCGSKEEMTNQETERLAEQTDKNYAGNNPDIVNPENGTAGNQLIPETNRDEIRNDAEKKQDGAVNDVTDPENGIGGAAEDLVDGIGDAGKDLVDGVGNAGKDLIDGAENVGDALTGEKPQDTVQ